MNIALPNSPSRFGVFNANTNIKGYLHSFNDDGCSPYNLDLTKK